MAMAFTVTGAQAAETVTLQLKWVPQAQFAGYYVAQEKGFYKDAGLDVTIKPGGTDISPVQVIAGKSADVIVNWMPDALAAREAGVPLVNISQIYDRSGMMLTCKKASGISTPADLKGKTLGVWFGDHIRRFTGNHLYRRNIGAARFNGDIQAGVFIKAFFLRHVITGKLGLWHPLQL
jgi:NitT/TauT family transport system substrate-binding protein